MKLKLDNPKGFIAAFMMMGAVVVFVLWMNFERGACVRNMKIEFQRLQDSIVEAGYDISYSDVQFSHSNLIGVMTIKELRINNLNADDYIEYYADEVQLNPSFFNIGKVNMSFKGSQRLILEGDAHQVSLPEFYVQLGFCHQNGLKSLSINGKNIEVEDIIKIEDLALRSKRTDMQQANYASPFFETHLELNNVELKALSNWPISNKIESVSLDANIKGALKFQTSYKTSITSWLKQGGMIDIPKLTLNWDYFNMVGKGDIHFNENQKPIMHLNTSSKGLLEMLNAFQNNDMLDSKGVFVAKILLGNKAFKLKDDDQYSTITTPINIDPSGLTVEDITIKTFE